VNVLGGGGRHHKPNRSIIRIHSTSRIRANEPNPVLFSIIAGPAKIQAIYRAGMSRNTGQAIEIAKENARTQNRRITGAENRENSAINRTIAPVSGGRIPSFLVPPSQRSASAQQRNHVPLRRLGALEKQSAPEAGLRTRECHSALTAMRPSRRERKRKSIYPRYSRVRRAWPIAASPAAMRRSMPPRVTVAPERDAQ